MEEGKRSAEGSDATTQRAAKGCGHSTSPPLAAHHPSPPRLRPALHHLVPSAHSCASAHSALITPVLICVVLLQPLLYRSARISIAVSSPSRILLSIPRSHSVHCFLHPRASASALSTTPSSACSHVRHTLVPLEDTVGLTIPPHRTRTAAPVDLSCTHRSTTLVSLCASS